MCVCVYYTLAYAHAFACGYYVCVCPCMFDRVHEYVPVLPYFASVYMDGEEHSYFLRLNITLSLNGVTT